MRTALFLAVSTLGLVLASCGGGGGNEALEWQGDEPHFVVRGYIGGREIDLDLNSTNAEIGCVREYVVPVIGEVPDESMARYVETEVDVVFEYMGQSYDFQFEFKEHDLQNNTVGDTITVIPRVDTELPAANEIWLEFEWESADETDTFEQSAQQGTVRLELFSGTPPQGSNIIPENMGSVGLTGSGVWSATEQLEFSLTAVCDENGVDEVVE